MIKVEIDSNSGFCGGVIRAIRTAEDFLKENGGTLISLGDVVHNEEELARLASLGLQTLEKSEIDTGKHVDGVPLMIRAHGEPPSVYKSLSTLGYKVIDCTCPVVLKLQKDIREARRKGQILIFGKIGHPEVLGLVGQVDGQAVVVENIGQLNNEIHSGNIDLNSHIEVFSQTTMSPEAYAALCEHLVNIAQERPEIHETICSQVAHRHRDLAAFASSHDVIVFVSGRHSSNGKVLYELCRSNNPRSYMVSRVDEIQREWFNEGDSVGVGGATSTPKWLLEEVADAIEKI